MDEAAEMAMIFDPNYQNNKFLIESAMQQIGTLEPPQLDLPDIFDEQLRALIDAVPLE